MSIFTPLQEYKARVNRDFDEWRPNALCSIMDTDAFYETGVTPQRSIATSVCVMCPVRWHCLEYAIVMEEHGSPHVTRAGVWGGMADRDREKFARTLRAKHPNWPEHLLIPLLQKYLTPAQAGRK